MKSYCLKRMRGERVVIFRLLIAGIVVNCLCAAVCGALWKVLDQEQTRAPLIFSGVFLTLALFVSGVYLRESDLNQLFKKTVFGRALVIFGDKKAGHGGFVFDELRSSRELMAEIDEEALHMDYECVSFALMRHWAVFYRYFNGNVYSIPVEKRWITRIWWEKADGGENSGFDVYVERAYDHPGSPGVYRVWEQADIEALREWSVLQEKTEE